LVRTPAFAMALTSPIAMAADAEGLMLLSWNVAGWSATHGLIERHYGSLDAYLERMGSPAFFCAQEVKVQSKDLKNEVVAKKLGAVSQNYRSYWGFNGDGRGFQGVATWVRNDVPVERATQSVFGVPELDQQGRALLTDHGACAVINVYVPFAGSSAEPADLQAKLRFLEALGDAMDKLRSQGKRVVLCGDLNLTHRVQDQKLGRRLLWVDDVGLIERLGCDAAPLGPFEDWAGQWQPVKEVSARAGVPMLSLGDQAECIHIRETGCVPWLRSRILPAGGAAWADVFAEVHPDVEERFTMWNQMANLRYINTGSRIDYVICDRETFQDCLVRCPSSCLAGGRLPAAAADPAATPSSTTATAEPAAVHPASASAALNAATNFGAWHAAASFGLAQGDGLTLQVDDMKLNDSQFPPRPHTGLVYTPPAYSDHIAVSALFAPSLLGVAPPASAAAPTAVAAEAPDAATKRCRPWLAQPSIASFFGATPRRTAPPGACSDAAAASASELTPPPLAKAQARAGAPAAKAAAPKKRRRK